MNETVNVFILAAGRGERLRPISDHIPKPLLPILGKPVLEMVLDRVSNLSPGKIGINLHFKKEVIEEWITRSAFIETLTLFPEEPVLGTGGALKNAEQFLRESTFLVHNADVLSDINLDGLIEFHLSSENLVTLAVHDFPEFNTLCVDERGFLKEIGAGERPPAGAARRLAFTGIAVYSSDFLRFIPTGVSSVVDAWVKAIANGLRIATLDVTGCYWTDIGQPSSYASAVIRQMRSSGETVYIHQSSTGCESGEMEGYIVLEEGSVINQSAFLRNCIVLPGSHIEGKAHHENHIVGQDFTIVLKEHELFGLSEESDRILIGTGGSDRSYYRIKRATQTAVLMQCADNDKDFQRHIAYTWFFLRYAVPVPELISEEPGKKRAVFEDLGDMSLSSWMHCPREEDRIGEMYRKVLDILVLLHTEANRHRGECPHLQERVFDYAHFSWETSYFMEQFVKGIQKKVIRNASELSREFHNLALKADAFPKTVIHRDFQSQNIMIKGGVPRIIDYQGARLGPPAYDIVSILWDPYCPLNDEMKEGLLNYYMNGMRRRNDGTFDEALFLSSLIPCRLQRHMQALGAYGFLSAVKEKTYFLKYVPEALRLLREGIQRVKDEYPALCDLIRTV